MTQESRLSAPANLLLAGEYAVLEEGGLGLGMAVQPRATALRRPGPARIRGVLGREEIFYPDGGGSLALMAQSLNRALPDWWGETTIDTSAFFGEGGRKKGYGSSAVAAVLLSALWLYGPNEARNPGQRPPLDRSQIFRAAVKVHRAGQRGHGSGYDVACSALGGFILFTGGEAPEAQHISLPWMPRLSLVPGERAVRSVGAVSRYRDWKQEQPAHAATFLRESNHLIRLICESDSWDEGRCAIEAYSQLSIDLGRRIGVRAEPPSAAMAAARSTYPRKGNVGTGSVEAARTFLAKSVGAGNELLLLMGEPENSDWSGEPVVPETEGVRWE
jgi:phosphomevalonate kinase